MSLNKPGVKRHRTKSQRLTSRQQAMAGAIDNDTLIELLEEGRRIRQQVHEDFKSCLEIDSEDLDIRLRGH